MSGAAESENMDTAGVGARGAKKRKREESTLLKVKEEMADGRVRASISRAVSPHATHVGAVSRETIANNIVRLLCSEASDKEMAEIMATLVVKQYRFATVIETKAGALYRHDGALYKKVEGKRSNTSDVLPKAVELTQAMLTTVSEELGTLPGDEAPTCCIGRVREMITKLSETRYAYNSVGRPFMDCVERDEFYAKNDLLTPTEFMMRADSDPFLLGFENGVFDFNHGRRNDDDTTPFKFHHKGAVPAAFIVTMSVGYDYDGPDEPGADGGGGEPSLAMRFKMDEMYKRFLEKVFFKPDMLEAVKQVLGSIPFGGSIELKKLVIFLGHADAGKSGGFFAPLRIALGDYFGTLPKSLILQGKNEKSPDAPTPSLCANYKRRVCVISELGENAVYAQDDVKELIGGDEMSLRSLYHGTFLAVPQFKLFVNTNHAGKVEDNADFNCKLTAFSCDAHFTSDIDKVDEARGIFLKCDQAELRGYVNDNRMAMMMIIITCALDFHRNGHALKEPDSTSYAATCLRGANVMNTLIDFANNYYEFTATRDDDKFKPDWDKHLGRTVRSMTDVRGDFLAEHPDLAMALYKVSDAKIAEALLRLGPQFAYVKISETMRTKYFLTFARGFYIKAKPQDA